MKRMLFTLAAAGLAYSSWAVADGAQTYNQNCADCHGRKANQVAFGKAPPLISLSRQQLVSGLTDRRDGKIATSGAEQRAKESLSDADIQGLADYIQTLKH
ncbi:c-type cytochrome [Martelella alba]|uniref:C-type cytochrome n=1 Tax=Martelella alba TaxID=2590451 RepID=A0ABY2SHI3_9HYPH|nr:c-type cytochrome [Martelella alba]TKI04774.1 c-type cytochrome [Martelella alba]